MRKRKAKKVKMRKHHGMMVPTHLSGQKLAKYVARKRKTKGMGVPVYAQITSSKKG